MNNDNNQSPVETEAETNDLPVIREEETAVEIPADVVNADEVAVDAPDTDELPAITTENEQA